MRPLYSSTGRRGLFGAQPFGWRMKLSSVTEPMGAVCADAALRADAVPAPASPNANVLMRLRRPSIGLSLHSAAVAFAIIAGEAGLDGPTPAPLWSTAAAISSNSAFVRVRTAASSHP